MVVGITTSRLISTRTPAPSPKNGPSWRRHKQSVDKLKSNNNDEDGNFSGQKSMKVVTLFVLFLVSISIQVQMTGLFRVTTSHRAVSDSSYGLYGHLEPTDLVTNTIRNFNDGIVRNQSTPKPRKWAYAFLMAGVDAKDRSYKGIFYNVLVAAEIMKDSKADIIVMVQMSYKSKATRLKQKEEDQLTAMNVKIHYLDVPENQNFYQIQFEKFHILSFTNYTRVIFMDGDVMPFCNMDYLFELSDPVDGTNQTLKENVVISWAQEPAHGGFFMLAPKEGDLDRLQEIIRRREDEVLEGKPAFDNVTGWGHVITLPDHWHSILGIEGENATAWAWHGDFADQGLLYYWTKYYKKDVSLIIKDEVENWSSRDGEIFHEETFKGLLAPFACLSEEYTKWGKYAKSRFHHKYVPMRDFRHFSGNGKPWLEKNLNGTLASEDVENTNPQTYWMYVLRNVDSKLNMNLTFPDLNVPKANFGAYPTHYHVYQAARARQKKEVA